MENQDNKNLKQKTNKKSKKKNSQPSKFFYWWKWPLIVLVLSFCLSLVFGVASELALSGAGIAISMVVIVLFILLSIFADMVGVAVTAADIHPFRAMASKKVRGAKEAIKLIKNADRVASVCADVIGDICGILSGAAGATVAVALISESMNNFVTIVIASLVSAVIAALTIFGKALCKKYSMKHAEKIILLIGKCLSIFHINKKHKQKNDGHKNDSKELEEKTETLEVSTESEEKEEELTNEGK